MERIPIEKGSMVMIKLSPEAEKEQKNALSRTFELLEDFYETTTETYTLHTKGNYEILCIPKPEQIIKIAMAKNLNTLKEGKLIWSDGPFIVENITLDEKIEDMSFMFLSPENMADPINLSEEMMAPTKEGFLTRLGGMFSIDHNDSQKLNELGVNILTTYCKYYSLVNHLMSKYGKLMEVPEWEFLQSEMKALQRWGIVSIAKEVDAVLEFPYGDFEITKALFSSDNGDELTTE